MVPHLEGLIAAHDIILLGERGQGKTCTIRTWSGFSTSGPAIAGCEIKDHPYQPACTIPRLADRRTGDDLPVT